MSLSSKEYAAVIRSLPAPTLGQTERFARYVSGAHSWYKHLPVHPRVPFVFYLDPGAGMNHVRTATGETALVEIADESTRFHYTWQMTSDYRRRFGYWNYHAAYGTSFMYGGEGGVINTAGAGLSILLESGDWVGVPPELAETGTALVSACVHPSPNIRMWMNDSSRFGLAVKSRFNSLISDEGFLLAALQRAFSEDRSTPLGFSRLDDGIPPQVMEMIQQITAERSRDHWSSGGWDWPDDHWLEQLQASGIGADLISLIVKHIEIHAGQRLDASARPGRTITEQLFLAVHEERARQLLGMTAAMQRFAGAC
jgi:hypothetical protein